MDNALDTRQLPSIPVVSRKRFADLVGVSEDTVSGWINRGYLPAFKMGKYRLVNLAMLNKLAIEMPHYTTGADQLPIDLKQGITIDQPILSY